MDMNIVDNQIDLNVWKSVKTTEFPKEKKFDILDVRGIVISTNLNGSRQINFQTETVHNSQHKSHSIEVSAARLKKEDKLFEIAKKFGLTRRKAT